jgi:hypothetical protein
MSEPNKNHTTVSAPAPVTALPVARTKAPAANDALSVFTRIASQLKKLPPETRREVVTLLGKLSG